MYYDYLDTPVGVIQIQASEKGITQVIFVDKSETITKNKTTKHQLAKQCKEQLKQYFAGKRTEFNLPIDLQGTTFQQSVWQCLLQIPFGETHSYYDIAKIINNPKAVRAVGAANGKNPIGIIVPCHRVIGKNGTLTGYAGGLDRKAWLLKHETYTL